MWCFMVFFKSIITRAIQIYLSSCPIGFLYSIESHVSHNLMHINILYKKSSHIQDGLFFIAFTEDYVGVPNPDSTQPHNTS